MGITANHEMQVTKLVPNFKIVLPFPSFFGVLEGIFFGPFLDPGDRSGTWLTARWCFRCRFEVYKRGRLLCSCAYPDDSQ